MQPKMCTKCKKNIAVIFISKIENGVTMNEGYCLKCARSLGIPQIDEAVRQMGISEEDLDMLTDEMSSMFGQRDGSDDADDDEIDSQTATFPLLNQLFGGGPAASSSDKPAKPDPRPEPPHEEEDEERKSPKKKNKKHKFLDSYCMDLTSRAREGKLDKVIGRDEETERVIQILNRRQKNNPCLIGEPGVGKTAIAEGLAQRIAAGDVPYKLRDKEVFLLDLTALVAGTQFRGQFESRMKSLIGEVKECGNIILVIDEVHNLVGAGDAEGSMNAANILKPALSRGEIQVIGATTFAEYRKYIEKDAALERRFQPVSVPEPSIAEASQIMQGIAKAYAEFHGVQISPEIAHQCVVLSERYITDRFLPDKAIDLLDEACSDVNLRCKHISELAELKKERDDYQLELGVLNDQTENQDYARLAFLRSKLLQIAPRIEELEKLPAPSVTMENLARIIELWTKIPASKIKAQEYEQIKGLASRLKEYIVGQDEAVDAVARAIRRNRVGISPKKRPVSFIFVGPTGVGKTELVKRLSDDLFDTVDSLIRLDMSEYMEKHTVSKLIGSPPGYVGYDEAGQLTEKIRRKPYSVILFDEIEKAHPDVLNVLLQILDDGQ
ncbi:MAG: ATP-dependent Clp protease ATP-binding subunit, partial [Oscillospiraceae bacterium]|nr:ATP-dependent Clp protease ATP-binding subunit [Oscillospiraceae bacterium]